MSKIDFTMPKWPVPVSCWALASLAGPSFGESTTFSGASTAIPFASYAIATADFDRDGRTDVVVASSKRLEILLGTGDGRFTVGTSLPTGSTDASAVAAEDLNGDGNADIVATKSVDKQALVFHGAGNGSFQLAQTAAAGQGAQAIAIDDLDGDGFPDLAITNGPSNKVATLFNLGDGTFSPPTKHVTGMNPSAVAIGDLDGDGNPDLVVSNRKSGDVSLLLGTGAGFFAPQEVQATGGGAKSTAIDDYDGDGVLDLATANMMSQTVSVHLGVGDGTFSPGASFAVGPGSHLLSGDWDGDDVVDLVVVLSDSDLTTEDLVVLRGIGDGSFVEESRFSTRDASSAAIADFDLDGHPDLAVCDQSYRDVAVFFGRSGESFLGPQDSPLGYGPQDFRLADVDGDGVRDLIAHGSQSTLVRPLTVSRGLGAGVFQEPVVLHVYDPLNSVVTAIEVADVDGDDDVDVLARTTQATIEIFENDGTGDFPSVRRTRVPSPYGNRMVVGDFNRDERPDIVVSGTESLSLLLADAHGLYSVQSLGSYAFVSGLTAADLDRDGDLDLIVTEAVRSSTSVLLGDGQGHFEGSVAFEGLAGGNFAVGDLDANGTLDVTFASSFQTFVALGLGDGQLATPKALPGSFLSGPGLAVGDVDSDGVLDIVVPRNNASLAVFHGAGGGRFDPPQTFATGTLPGDLVITRMDARPGADILVGCYDSRSVSLISGR